MKSKAEKTVKWYLKNLYQEGQNDMLEKIGNILASNKAELVNKKHPNMNGEAWFYWIQEQLERDSTI